MLKLPRRSGPRPYMKLKHFYTYEESPAAADDSKALRSSKNIFFCLLSLNRRTGFRPVPLSSDVSESFC